MGRDTLVKLLREYYWGRTDKMNWTKEDDERLIDRIISFNKIPVEKA